MSNANYSIEITEDIKIGILCLFLQEFTDMVVYLSNSESESEDILDVFIGKYIEFSQSTDSDSALLKLSVKAKLFTILKAAIINIQSIDNKFKLLDSVDNYYFYIFCVLDAIITFNKKQHTQVDLQYINKGDMYSIVKNNMFALLYNLCIIGDSTRIVVPFMDDTAVTLQDLNSFVQQKNNNNNCRYVVKSEGIPIQFESNMIPVPIADAKLFYTYDIPKINIECKIIHATGPFEPKFSGSNIPDIKSDIHLLFYIYETLARDSNPNLFLNFEYNVHLNMI